MGSLHVFANTTSQYPATYIATVHVHRVLVVVNDKWLLQYCEVTDE